MEHKHAAVLRAIADGKVAQFRASPSCHYITPDEPLVVNPLTRPGLEWRIAPERKADVVMFANVFASDSQLGFSVPASNLAVLKATEHKDRVGIIRVTITHDENGNPQRGTVEWCDE